MTDAKYIPLTFVTSTSEKERLIRNTILLRHFGARAEKEVSLSHYIEGTQYGFNASAKESGTNRFVRISDITNGEIEWDTVPFCECDDPAGYLLYDNDLLVARTGGTTGKSYMVVAPPKDSIFAGYLIRIRANEDTNPEFLSVFLNSYFYWGQITSLNRDEYRPSVNAKKLSALKLPRLDRSIQDEIAELASSLEKADSSIASEIRPVIQARTIQDELGVEITHQQTLLGKLKQAILQEAIQGKLTADWRAANPNVEPASELLQRIQAEKARLIAEKKIRKEKPLPEITPEEIPFEIPEGWEWCRIGAIGSVKVGATPKREDAKLWGGAVSWVSSGEVANNEIWKTRETISNKATDSTSAKVNPAGSVLVAMIGQGKTRGQTAILKIDAATNQNVAAIRLQGSVLSEFVWLFFLGRYEETRSGASGGNQPALNGIKIRNSMIPLPPLSEQAAIVERVEALMTTCRELEAEIEHSRTHAADLLQAVLKEAFAPAST